MFTLSEMILGSGSKQSCENGDSLICAFSGKGVKYWSNTPWCFGVKGMTASDIAAWIKVKKMYVFNILPLL